VHTGSVRAAVAGTDTPRCLTFGRATIVVGMAEATGPVGRVHITAVTAARLTSPWVLEPVPRPPAPRTHRSPSPSGSPATPNAAVGGCDPSPATPTATATAADDVGSGGCDGGVGSCGGGCGYDGVATFVVSAASAASPPPLPPAAAAPPAVETVPACSPAWRLPATAAVGAASRVWPVGAVENGCDTARAPSGEPASEPGVGGGPLADQLYPLCLAAAAGATLLRAALLRATAPPSPLLAGEATLEVGTPYGMGCCSALRI
jgi:hypothetical protein